jgi:5-formyltetrahydrofolate cyclo-ligase
MSSIRLLGLLDKSQLRRVLSDRRLSEDWVLNNPDFGRQLQLLGQQMGLPKVVAGFWPLAGEASPVAFLNWAVSQGVSVYLPQGYRTATAVEYRWALFSSESDLEVGPFGVLQPSSVAVIETDQLKTKADWWLVPGLGFDVNGHRLGMGMGFYDQFLVGAIGVKIGLCYEWQIVDAVPVDAWDIAMSVMVTPSRYLFV